MHIVTMMAQLFDSGKFTLSTNDKEDLEVTVESKKIDVNLKDKEFIKNLMRDVLRSRKNESTIRTIRDSSKNVKTAKFMRETLIDAANELKQEGITITLSYQADIVATAGAQASAGISRLITGTKAIEINNLPKLAELGIYLL